MVTNTAAPTWKVLPPRNPGDSFDVVTPDGKTLFGVKTNRTVCRSGYNLHLFPGAQEQARADFDLIGAAPDMLKTLEHVEEFLENAFDDYHDRITARPTLEAVQNTIRQAKGLPF
ncbi:Uncharacterised protein [uncultured archaeon]|nr:Uncharacterised protein [uncultured archaeon]